MVDVYDPVLDQMLEDAEDAVTDFKSWKVVRNPHNNGEPNRRKLVEALVGFANRDGGNLIIGVSDTTREPEGESLNEERINGIIAEVAADESEPNVQWDNSFYTSDDGDLEEGDVYVVHIERRRGTPHAITHGEGKREYRIRAGDETRLLKTDELDWLFRNQDTSDYYQHIDSALVFHKDFNPLKIELPASHGWMYNYIWKLSDDDEDFLTTDFQNMMDFAIAIAPFGLISSLNRYHMNSWDIVRRTDKQERMPFSSGMTQPTPEIDPNMDVPMDEVGQTGIKGIGTSILETLSLDEGDLITHSEFKTPPEVNVEVLLGDAAESSDYYGRSNIVITKRDKFRFVIEFGKRMQGGAIENSVLDWHPISNLIKLGDYGKPAVDPLSDVEFSIRLLTDFHFPDYVDNEYEVHTRYAENIAEILRSDWDLDAFLDEIPSHIQYEMNYKLDMLVDALELRD